MKAQRILLSVLLGLMGFLLWGQRAEAAGTTLSSIPNACWTTEQPFTLVENDRTQLTWDVHGNLTLVNHGGSKSRVVWGLNSAVPLVGAAAGKLCFGNGYGRLRIHDAAGNLVWVSGSYTATNGNLSIDQCTIQIKDTSGVVQWQQGTPNCDRRSLTTPPLGTSLSSIPNTCWSTEQPFVVLENDKAALTWDEYGNLTLANVGGGGSKVSWGLNASAPLKGATAGMLCFGNGSGYLRIHDAGGAVVWTSGTGYTAHDGSLSLDQCTMQIKDTGGVVRWQAATPACTQVAKPPPAQGANVLPASAQCWTTEQPVTLVHNDLAKVTWDAFGNLTIENHAGGHKKVSWGIGSHSPLFGLSKATLCFDGAAGFRIVDHSGNQVWSAGTPSIQNAYLTLDACTAEIRDGNGVTHWQESVPQCDKRRIVKPASDMCWSAHDDNRILWDDDHHIELWFTQQGLFFEKDGSRRYVVGGDSASFGQTTLCYKSDGSLVSHLSYTLSLVRASDAPDAAMSLDANGLSFTDGVFEAAGLPLEYKRFDAGPRPSTVDAGWCRTTELTGPIVQSGNMHLNWTSGGLLTLMVGDGDSPVDTLNFDQPGNVLCFGANGSLKIYNAFKTPFGNVVVTTVWDNGASDSTSTSWQLTLDTCDIYVAEARITAVCARYQANEIKHCTPGTACTRAEQDEWDLAANYCVVQQFGQFLYHHGGGYCDPNVSGTSFSFVKDMQSGDSDFGAELWVIGAALNTNGINTLVDAARGTGGQDTVDDDLPLGHGNPPSTYFEVLGDAGAGITLFGEHMTVLDATGYVEVLTLDEGPKAHVAVTSLGATLYSLDASGDTDQHWSREFFKLDQTYTLGCIPVTVHAAVTGTIGIHAGAHPTVAGTQVVGFGGTLEPYASLDLDASVGVGVSGASAGIEGELNLVRLSFPFTLDITSIEGRTYETSLDFNVHTLEGEIDLYAELGSLSASKEIASFEGYATSANLFTQSGTL